LDSGNKTVISAYHACVTLFFIANNGKAWERFAGLIEVGAAIFHMGPVQATAIITETDEHEAVEPGQSEGYWINPRMGNIGHQTRFGSLSDMGHSLFFCGMMAVRRVHSIGSLSQRHAANIRWVIRALQQAATDAFIKNENIRRLQNELFNDSVGNGHTIGSGNGHVNRDRCDLIIRIGKKWIYNPLHYRIIAENLCSLHQRP
jgi:hypothetical protein